MKSIFMGSCVGVKQLALLISSGATTKGSRHRRSLVYWDAEGYLPVVQGKYPSLASVTGEFGCGGQGRLGSGIFASGGTSFSPMSQSIISCARMAVILLGGGREGPTIPDTPSRQRNLVEERLWCGGALRREAPVRFITSPALCTQMSTSKFFVNPFWRL